MDHHPLIATIAVGLVLAFIFGAVAQRLRISPLVGYLVAGIVVGPYTPGFIADQALASELAEVGVILLMFGVGLHFSLGSLLSVASIAIPGAIAQIDEDQIAQVSDTIDPTHHGDRPVDQGFPDLAAVAGSFKITH